MGEKERDFQKKKEKYYFISIYEILAVFLGIGIFIFPCLSRLRIPFILSIIILYWILIRFYETKIHQKKQEIYNVPMDYHRPIVMSILEKIFEKARIPLQYDLEQLEFKRKSLIDKFVVINLIFLILIELFIRE